MILIARIFNSLGCAISLYALVMGYFLSGILLFTLYAGSLACFRSKFSKGARKVFLVANGFFFLLCSAFFLHYIFQDYPFFISQNVLLGLFWGVISVTPMLLNIFIIKEVNGNT